MAHTHNHTAGAGFEKPIVIGILLNATFIAVEVVYGLISDSVALLSDAGHNFSDVISLILAWVAIWLIKKRSSSKFTYGFKKGSILIALVNSLLLLTALGVITWEAVQRFYIPHEVNGEIVIIVASIGIIINGFTAYMFNKGEEQDINIKSAFLHMMTDALVSAGVVVSGIIILIFDFVWIDPVISLIIVVVILISSWSLIKETLSLSLDAVPENLNAADVRKYLMSVEGVTGVHDLHIWSISTSQPALTSHITVNNDHPNNELLSTIRNELHSKFGIEHSTIQIESNEAGECEDCGD